MSQEKNTKLEISETWTCDSVHSKRNGTHLKQVHRRTLIPICIQDGVAKFMASARFQPRLKPKWAASEATQLNLQAFAESAEAHKE